MSRPLLIMNMALAVEVSGCIFTLVASIGGRFTVATKNAFVECRALSVVLVVVVRLLDDARPFGEVEGAAHGDGSGGPPGEQNALQLAHPLPLMFLPLVNVVVVVLVFRYSAARL